MTILLSTVYCDMHDAKNEQLYNITWYCSHVTELETVVRR